MKTTHSNTGRSALRILRRAFLCVLLLNLFTACAARRKELPPGVVPSQSEVKITDEQYGQQVAAELANQYKLDNNDARINRVRDIIDRLAKAAHADQNPWNAYVFKDDKFKNAAATRGNFVFVWTGILNVVHDDAELSAILAHEIGHVLAGHTADDPSEETGRMIAGVAGTVANEILASQGYGILADIAEALISSSVEAVIVNPDTQSKELEADRIGLFLMADAGFDPQSAVNFWNRVKDDPDFSGGPLSFMSTHPSSTDRLEQLQKLLSDAEERFHHPGQQKPAVVEASQHVPSSKKHKQKTIHQKSAPTKQSEQFNNSSSQRSANESWEVVDKNITVYEKPDTSSAKTGSLKYGTNVSVINEIQVGRRYWLEISSPSQGFVESRFLSPFGK